MAGSHALLLLADGRLPAGGYAHSGSLESAVRSGRVEGIADLREFLLGQVSTTGAVAAAFAAASCHACAPLIADPDQGGAKMPLDHLQAEFAARTPSPALRRVSESLGRQLLRAMSAIHSHPLQQQLPRRMYQPIAFGAAAAMLDLPPREAAQAILHETTMAPAMAVVKLMSVDPFEAHHSVAELLPVLDEIADRAEQSCTWAPSQLPANSAPLTDILAEGHDNREVRLFAS